MFVRLTERISPKQMSKLYQHFLCLLPMTVTRSLFWCQCDKLCTAGFVNDVMFAGKSACAHQRAATNDEV